MYNSIYPINIKPYSGPKNKQSVTSQSEDESSGEKKRRNYFQRNNQQQEQNQEHQKQQEYPSDTYVKSEITPKSEQKDYSDHTYSNNVNIAQIIMDFKNTATAIGTPQELFDEVNTYFELIEKQSKKTEPNRKLIQSNLKNASLLLDNYITESLGKQSHVVENWIDTLFLQKVDYQYNIDKVNPDFQIKFPEREQRTQETTAENTQASEKIEQKEVVQTVTQPEITAKKKYYIPENKDLKKLYVQAKKYSMINEPEKALRTFQKALEKSIEIKDDKAQAMIYYEAGQIFDQKDLLSQALKNYYKASQTASDSSVKSKVHYNMAKIYDDVVQIEPAVDHYFVAISYAGEDDDFRTQSKSLVNIATLYAEQQEKKKAKEYAELSNQIAKETKKPKFIASILAKSGKAYTVMGENRDALKFFKKSTREYKKTSSHDKVAKNCLKAAKIMLKMGNLEKAKNLYKTAYNSFAEINDEKSMKLVFQELSKF